MDFFTINPIQKKYRLTFYLSTIILLPLFLLSFSLVAGTSRLVPKESTSAPFGFYEYLPSGYTNDGGGFPVILYLHGYGERAGKEQDINNILNAGLPKVIEGGRDLPFIVLAPQSRSFWYYSNPVTFFDWMKKNYNIDPSRIYVTGFSMGGTEAWKLGIERAEEIAAIAPLCGKPTDDLNLDYCRLKTTPTWAFHGADDNILHPKFTQAAIDEYNTCNPNPKPKFTVYPGVGHNELYELVYTGSKGDDVYSWFLSHKLGEVPQEEETNLAPKANAGTDMVIELPQNSLTIKGTATDADGVITKYNWKKTTGPSASLSGTTTPQLAISNLTEGGYEFTLTVTDDDGASHTDKVAVTVLAAEDSPPQSTGDYTVYVNFNRVNPAPAPWNNTNSATVTGRNWELNTSEGINSNIRLTLLTSWGKEDGYGGHNDNKGMTSALYPNQVSQAYYWSLKNSGEQIKLSGLNTTGTYTLTFFASRDGGGDKTSIYTVNGKSASLNAAYNRTNTASLENLQASTGELIIDIKRGANSSYCYINALVITYYSGQNARTEQRVATSENVNDSSEEPTAYYHSQQLFIKQTKENTLNSIRVTDLSGRIYMLNSTYDRENYRSFDAAKLPSGIYIVSLPSNSEENPTRTRVFKND